MINHLGADAISADHMKRARPTISPAQFALLLGLLAVAALSLRIWPLVLNPGTDWAVVQADSAHSILSAEGIRHGCGYAMYAKGRCAVPEVRYPPGYALFLSVMPSLRAALAVQAAMGVAVCVLTAFSASIHWGYKAGLLAFCFYGFDFACVVAGESLLGDQLFELVLAAILLAVARMSKLGSKWLLWSALIGVMTACAIMIRPTAILLPFLATPIPFLLFTKKWKEKIICTSLCVVIPSVTMLLWIHRNYSCCGVATIATAGAGELYGWKAARVISFAEHESFEQAQAALYSTVPKGYVDRDPDALERAAWRIILGHPAATLRATLVEGAMLLLIPPGASFMRMFDITWRWTNGNIDLFTSLPRIVDGLRAEPFAACLVGGMILFAAIIWVGTLTSLARIRTLSPPQLAVLLFAAAASVSLLAPHAVGSSKFRSRTQSAPFVALMAGVGWCYLSRRRDGAPRFRSLDRAGTIGGDNGPVETVDLEPQR
jgi:hypothetical protein